MGYGDAINFLSKLDGLPAPTNWVGALPINYNIGPGSATVYIKTNNTFFKSQIWNVIAKIDGTDDQEGDDFVVIGNHRYRERGGVYLFIYFYIFEF